MLVARAATFLFRMRRNARARASRYLTVLFRHALIDSLNVRVSLSKKSAWRSKFAASIVRTLSKIGEKFKVSMINKDKGKEPEFVIFRRKLRRKRSSKSKVNREFTYRTTEFTWRSERCVENDAF